MNFEELVALCNNTHQQLVATASRVIDTHLAARNFLFGHYIVHFEQEGADRARYAKQTLTSLSQALKSAVGRGFSVDNLELMQRFYLQFRADILRAPISDTLSRKSLPQTPEKSATASVTSIAGLCPPLFLEGSVPTKKIQQTLSVESCQSLRLAGGPPR